MKKEQSHAILTLFGAAEMSDGLRKEIAEWLWQKANDLIKEGDNYSKVFRARFIK